MSTLMLIVMTTLPLVTWIGAIAFHRPIRTKWGYPRWMNNTIVCRMLPVMYYVVFTMVIGIYVTVPLSRGISGVILIIPMLTITYLSYKAIFRNVAPTRLDKALIVVTFLGTSVFIMPLSYILIYLAQT